MTRTSKQGGTAAMRTRPPAALLAVLAAACRAQPHPPGSGFPGRTSAEIVPATFGEPMSGHISASDAVQSTVHCRECAVWYSFEPTANHVYVATTALRGLTDSTVAVYEASSATEAHRLAEDDDSGLGLASVVVFGASTSATLYVRVRAYSRAQSGGFNVTLVDATTGGGPEPCLPPLSASASSLNCDLAQACASTWNTNRGSCPSDFSCDASCAPLLVPWWAAANDGCKALVRSMPEWPAYAGLGGSCDTSAYGTPDLAILIREGETQSGRISRRGYREWFRFDARRGSAYSITTTLRGHTLRASVLFLYDADTTTILEQNDDYDGLASGLEWTATSTATFYVMVRAYASHDTGTFSLTLAEAQESGWTEAALCTENGDRVPWRAIHFAAGCEVWVSYTEVSGAQSPEPVELLEVGGVSIAQLLRVASDICGSAELVRAFAEDFEGIAELAGVTIAGGDELGQVGLTVRNGRGAVSRPVVTVSQSNQRYTRSQWRTDYDELVFSGRTCPAWVDDEATVLSEVVLEGRLTAEQFRASIAAIVVQSALPQAYAAELAAVTISAYSQTVASSIALPGAVEDFDVSVGDAAAASAAEARQQVLREGIASSINDGSRVPAGTVSPADVVITSVAASAGSGRRRLQAGGGVSVGYQLASSSDEVSVWMSDQFFVIRMANSINDADTGGAIQELTVLNFAMDPLSVSTSIEYELDTGALTPTVRSAVALAIGDETTVMDALAAEGATVTGATFVSLTAASSVDPQCATYVFSSITGDEFDSTLVEGGAIAGNPLVLGDEQLSIPIDLESEGVTFHYFNRAVKWLVVSSNGFVYLRSRESRLETLAVGEGLLSTGRGAGERLPERSFGALIAPYWEDYDPAGVHCGNAPGEVHWKAITEPTTASGLVGSPRSLVVEFDRVKACGGGGSDAGKNVASWQLVLHGGTDTFDIVLSFARGDTGLHTIGFQDWDGTEGQMICHGEGDSKCFKERTTYRVRAVQPSYRCALEGGVCATAALAALGAGGSDTDAQPRYAACECADCFSGDGLRCQPVSGCGEEAAEEEEEGGGEYGVGHLALAVLISLCVGVGGNLICHRCSICPMYRPKVDRVNVGQRQPDVVLGQVVGGQPPGGDNPLVVGAQLVGDASATGTQAAAATGLAWPGVANRGAQDAEAAKAQAHGAWVGGGGGGGGGGGLP